MADPEEPPLPDGFEEEAEEATSGGVNGDGGGDDDEDGEGADGEEKADPEDMLDPDDEEEAAADEDEADPDAPYDEPLPESEAEGEEEEEEEAELDEPAPPEPVVHDYSSVTLEFRAVQPVDRQGDWPRKVGLLGRSGFSLAPRAIAGDDGGDGGEDEGESGSKQPLLFRLLDESLQSLYVPDTALEPKTTYFRFGPRPGALLAEAVVGASPPAGPAEHKRILILDTLPDSENAPSVHGRELPAAERALAARVAAAISAADARAETDAAAALAARRTTLARRALVARLAEVREQGPDWVEPTTESAVEEEVKQDADSASVAPAEPPPAADEEPPAEDEVPAEPEIAEEPDDELDLEEDPEAPEPVPEAEPAPEPAEIGEDEAPPAEGEEDDEDSQQARREAAEARLEGDHERKIEWLEAQTERAAAAVAVAEHKVLLRRRTGKRARLNQETRAMKLEKLSAVARLEVRELQAVQAALAEQLVGGASAPGLVDLRTRTRAPPSTFQLIRAALTVVGRADAVTPSGDGGGQSTAWATLVCHPDLGPLGDNDVSGLLGLLATWDAEGWAGVSKKDRARASSAYKTLPSGEPLNTEEALKTFEAECPRSCLGWFLHRWLWHAQRAGAALEAQHAMEGRLAAAIAARAAARVAVKEAREDEAKAKKAETEAKEAAEAAKAAGPEKVPK